ncbi:hypothetical protein SDJN02_05904, partial [Cucurbita argyrosperma subsp. argyrosperma]
ERESRRERKRSERESSASENNGRLAAETELQKQSCRKLFLFFSSNPHGNTCCATKLSLLTLFLYLLFWEQALESEVKLCLL